MLLPFELIIRLDRNTARFCEDGHLFYRYSFGYGRYEVISGFTNGILLVFVSLMVLGEGLGRLIGNPEIETEHLTAVAVAGFCVNLIGEQGLRCEFGGGDGGCGSGAKSIN